MTKTITTFLRVEQKYVINESQKNELMKVFNQYMELDPYCKNNKTYHIQNIYYDTDTDLLIRRSLEKPLYKEKIRARKYLGTPKCFLEIKKKYNGVVGKRRIVLTLEELDKIFKGEEISPRDGYEDNQILKEIRYALSCYDLKPKVFISYDRLGYFSKEDPDLRITIDDNLHAKRDNFKWDQDDYETEIVPKGLYVMEIKSSHNFPYWLVKTLSELKVYKTSISKYGREYKNFLKENNI